MRALAVVVPIALLVLLAVPPAAAKPAPHQPDAAKAAKAAKPAKAKGEAKAKPAEPTVAVLPFVVAKDRLTMYGKPVADAVARKLSALSGHHAEALSLSGEVPDAVWLVVDGRIIAASDGTIRLEARLRDPRRGTAQPAVATAALPLADIDALAENLATKLAAGVVRPPPRRTGPKTAPATEPTPARGPSARPPRHVDRAPRAVVFVPAAPTLAAAALTRNLVALASRLGYAPVVSRRATGIAALAPTRATIAETGARLVIMVDLSDLDYRLRGVLTARGRARMVVVKDGRAAMDRVIATDTVVGSRGDSRAALAALVAEQLVIIAEPAVKRAIVR